MVFPSVAFAIFFPVVLALSWALMPYPRLWKPFILAASCVFYAAASLRYCGLLIAVALVNQLGAIAVYHFSAERLKRWLVAAMVTIDLGVLAVFKYFGFFTHEVGGFLNSIGFGVPLSVLELMLPVGLSFWIFQAISYVVDVKRGLLKPARTIDVAIYLSFFPHVVAGPIVRAREFLPQLNTPRNPHNVAVGAAFTLIAIGLVKKVAIADYLSRTVVDPVFGVPQAYAAPDVILAAYAFAAQIYCDFSGYTDIAIGVALLMGFIFPQNFNSPYKATSLRDFWRRWHMTLSRYLRDFLYIPLGGNRGGKLATARNLMITMVLGGLWHGAAWGFVLWGTLHGAGLVVEHALRGRVRLPSWLGWFVVFNFVVFGWILFRSRDLSLVQEFLARLAHPGPATLWTAPAVIAVIVVVGLQMLPPRPWERFRVWVADRSPATLGVSLALVVLFVGSTIPGGAVPPFIYFRF